MGRILPILFNTEMVSAILNGRKTATRCICKECNDFTIPDMGFFDPVRRTYAVHIYADKGHRDQLATAERPCPVCPGDILYVRETYCPNYFDFVTKYGNRHGYKADYDGAILSSDIAEPRWTPSIHMPKEAARIWLKVTGVTVERLNDMSGQDILKEGVDCRVHSEADYFDGNQKEMFAELWNSNLKKKELAFYGWEANPWVWVREFERCGKPESEG